MLLDVTSIAPASVLVLDSYFYVVVFHGTTVATWRKAEYHLNPEHAAFAQLLEVLLPCPSHCAGQLLGSVAGCTHFGAACCSRGQIEWQVEIMLCWMNTMLL